MEELKGMGAHVDLDPRRISLKVGLEIHQQLATKRKLFCNCPPPAIEEKGVTFVRRLRPTQSELGEVDPAAQFEFMRGRFILYHSDKRSSCLVEADEEPPHPLDEEALEAALLVALALRAEPLDEIHVMRKIVIDGSNTTGFQRTALVAVGGELEVEGLSVPVQTVSLEEDAARLLCEEGGRRDYSLDRLCIPLVEVSLAPITCTPQQVREVALAVGRLIRATGKAARGLGTIRQDINISVMNGPVVEVKGVQRLELVEEIVKYEVKRQLALHELAQRLRERGVTEGCIGEPVDVSVLLASSNSRVVRKILEGSGRIMAFPLKGFSGLLAWEPTSEVRLGKELAEVAKAMGLGGVIHSDELPGLGISEEEVRKVREHLRLEEGDAFLLVAGKEPELPFALRALQQRLLEALEGPPAQTRGPTAEGRTRYSRPRPGAARMYPETDIPPIQVRSELLRELVKRIPKPWREQVTEFGRKYGLSSQLAEQLLDSDRLPLFLTVMKETKLQPSFVAATLTETLVDLGRRGLGVERLTDALLLDLFERLDKGEMAKEAVPSVLEVIAAGRAEGVQRALLELGLKPMSREELEILVERLLDEDAALVKERGEGAFGPLMGKAMRLARGRIDGKVVSEVLKEKLAERLRKEG